MNDTIVEINNFISLGCNITILGATLWLVWKCCFAKSGSIEISINNQEKK